LSLQIAGFVAHYSAANSSGAMLAILGALVLLSATKHSYLRVVRYRDGRFWVTGFGHDFLAVVAAEGQDGSRET
jgi:hypothetical protein